MGESMVTVAPESEFSIDERVDNADADNRPPVRLINQFQPECVGILGGADDDDGRLNEIEKTPAHPKVLPIARAGSPSEPATWPHSIGQTMNVESKLTGGSAESFGNLSNKIGRSGIFSKENDSHRPTFSVLGTSLKSRLCRNQRGSAVHIPVRKPDKLHSCKPSSAEAAFHQSHPADGAITEKFSRSDSSTAATTASETMALRPELHNVLPE